MKVVERKLKFNINQKDIWFFEEKNIDVIEQKADSFILHGIDENLLKKIEKHFKKINLKKQYTSIIDLTEKEMDLYEKINKTVKYEINRCQKENFYLEVYEINKIDDSILNNFEIVYNNMYKDKGLKTTLNRTLVKDYINSDNFILTVAKKDDYIYVYHAYAFDENNVRLLYSCSNFRELEDKKAEIGRANKFLHWEDIKYFKSKGVAKYDLGGISSIDNPNGIDKFKMNFNGTLIEYYNVIVNNSFKSKLVAIVKFILGR